MTTPQILGLFFVLAVAIVAMCVAWSKLRRDSVVDDPAVVKLQSFVSSWCRRIELYCDGADVESVAKVVGWIVASDVAHYPPGTKWPEDDGFVSSKTFRHQRSNVEREVFSHVEFGSSVDCVCLVDIFVRLYLQSKNTISGTVWERRFFERRMGSSRNKTEMFVFLSLLFFWQIANAMNDGSDFLSEIAANCALLDCLGKHFLPAYVSSAREVQQLFLHP